MSTPKPKKIIICCDGTWNRPEKIHNYKNYRPTNVLRLARAISTHDKQGQHQVLYYDSGVGTDRGMYDQYVGGMTGLGLFSHLKKAYRFICHNYADGDELFFFGFSRGAYTVRALAGMIGAVGLLRSMDLGYLPAAFRYYNTHPDKRKNLPFYDDFIVSGRTRRGPIKFLGVWDTVGALGLPIPYLRLLSQWRIGYYNAELGDHIQHAFHAVAMDEKRGPFRPSLWSESGQGASFSREVCQVWFRGSHSDVGGGALRTELTNEALRWMIKRALSCGLTINADFIEEVEESCTKAFTEGRRGLPENSFNWLYKILVPLGILPHTRTPGRPPAIVQLLETLPVRPPIKKLLKKLPIFQYVPAINEMIHESVLPNERSVTESFCLETGVPVFREKEYQAQQKLRLVHETDNLSMTS